MWNINANINWERPTVSQTSSARLKRLDNEKKCDEILKTIERNLYISVFSRNWNLFSLQIITNYLAYQSSPVSFKVIRFFESTIFNHSF